MSFISRLLLYNPIMLNQIWHGRLGGLRLIMILAVAALLAGGLYCISLTAAKQQVYKQIIFIGIGLAAFAAVNLIHYQHLGRASAALFIVTLMLLAFVLIGKHYQWRSLVPNIRGSYRWINPIPGSSAFRIQPSEIAKITYILAVAWYLSHRRSYRKWSGLVVPFLITLMPAVLILVEPDLGTVLIFPPILFVILFAAGAKIRHLLAVILVALCLCPLFYATMKGYQKTRIQVLLNQNSEDTWWLRGPGYQLHQSKMYIGSGRMTGQSPESDDMIRLRPLPDSHNDFIFALIGRRWGFAGCITVLALYALLIFSGIEIASQQVDPFGRLVAVGIIALLAVQMIINIGMTIGLMPVTGMTLPFVSYGGSSLITSFLALGLLTNVARHRPIQMARATFEFND